MAEPAKPLSPAMRALRVFWIGWIVAGLGFCVVMAAWGDLRQGLMLKLLDDRYNKSFTIQAPQGTKIWLGTQYLGECQPHPLADGEQEDSTAEVEGMSVLLPRVYFYEPQLEEQSVACEFNDDPFTLAKKLAPDAKLIWTEKKTTGFGNALLRHNDGHLDFVVIARLQMRGGYRAFLLRVKHEQGHVFGLDHTEVWTDQLCADQGGFWPQRTEYEGLPDELHGQVKTIWRLFMKVESDEPWLKQHAPGETDVKWFKLAEE